MDTFENFMYIRSKKDIETITLKEYVGTNSVVTVPAEIDGVPIERLRATFKDNKTVEKVIIPDNIKTIAKDTFVNCPNLKEIVLPSSLEVIKVGTFKDIPKLEKLVYNGDKFELKDTSIVECTKLYDKQGFFILGNMLVACDGENEVVEIPEGITQIENSVFYHRLEIKKVIMPNSVRVIKANAFGCCKNLADLTLSQNLEYIRTYAFGYCSSLTELNIPPSVKMIYKCAFVGCVNLKIIKIDHNPIVQGDSFSYGLSMVNLPKYVINSFSIEALICFCIFGLSKWEQLSQLEQETITEEFKYKFIRDKLFYKYQSEEVSNYFSLGFSLSLEDLYEYLSYSIKQNDTVKTALLLEYKQKHFSKAELQDYQDNQDMLEIGLEMPTLEQLKRNWDISIYEGKITITGYRGSKSIESIPQSTQEGVPVTCINKGDMNHFLSIEKLIIPDGVEEIRPRAFYDTFTLKEIVLPQSLKFIGKMAFACTSIRKIELPTGLTNIAPSLFSDCKELESVTLPNSIEIIDRKAFEKCVSLVEIVLPPNVKSIGKQAFKGCTSLKRVILTCDINIDNIESDCFDNCLSIEFVGLINGENII